MKIEKIMDKKLKDKWVKALRSGEYRQGKGALCYHLSVEKRYCCLGVLAKTLDILDNENIVNIENGKKSGTYLPESILPMNIQLKLTRFNDEDDLSFLEIAYWIENNL